jgi:hypothetical protein
MKQAATKNGAGGTRKRSLAGGVHAMPTVGAIGRREQLSALAGFPKVAVFV